MLVAKEILINDAEFNSVDNYITSSILTGSLIRTYTDTSGSKYLSPIEYTYARPFEQFGRAREFRNITSLKYNDNIDYLFAPDNGFDAAPRFIFFFKFNKQRNEWRDSGYISINPLFTAAQSRTIGNISGHLYRYSSGSVEVNGSGVTGSGTNWADNRIFQGSRIGFGTTDPMQVSAWYEIADVPTNSNLTLQNSSVPRQSWQPGTPYVIEELKLITPIRQQTGSINGLVVINGIHENYFNNTTDALYQYQSADDDRKRGYYLIRDDNNSITGTGITSTGLFATAIHPERTSVTSHDAYLSTYLNSPARFQYHKFNINAPVSASTFISGATPAGYEFSTALVSAGGALNTFTGLNMELVKTSHGLGSGSYNLYHYLQQTTAATSRIYRLPVDDSTILYSGSTSILNFSMREDPAGGTDTRPIVGINYMTYVPSIDKFITTSAIIGSRITMLKYNNGVYDYVRYGPHNAYTYNRPGSWLSDTEQPKQVLTTADTNTTVTSTSDILYVAAGPSNATFTLSSHTLLAIPIACDWEHAPQTKQWATFPVIETPNAKSYSTIYTKSPKFIGSAALGTLTDQMIIYYRTTGIDDDSGEWKLVPSSGDLSQVPIANRIQFSVAWDVFGSTGLYNRLQGICFTYIDNQQDDHYLASSTESNISANEIVWIQVKLWADNIPELKINIYNNLNNQLLLNDTTTTQVQGVFEYSDDAGNTWYPWDATKDSIGNRIKYTANSLPANTNVKIILNKK
jgi:hypothetical protein